MLGKAELHLAKVLHSVQLVNEATRLVFFSTKEKETEEAMFAIRSMLFGIEADLKHNVKAQTIDEVRELTK